MFYEELYTELGKLFHSVAAADGTIHPSERASLQALIQTNWKPLEGSTDKYGTDQANLIGFAFDYQEAEGSEEDGLQSFIEFYRRNRSHFTPPVIDNILKTARAIGSAYHGNNKDEIKIIDRLISSLGIGNTVS